MKKCTHPKTTPENLFFLPLEKLHTFRKLLLYWHYHDNTRSLPWKNHPDPYHIWLSEIMLQQTQAQQVLPYYLRFTERYPTLESLAISNESEVFKYYEGLGYYARCRNLLHTARFIVQERGGIFPNTYEEIISLKGVGPYTAAAIASFAFGLPYAVIDGNVGRVLSRFSGMQEPIDSPNGKKLLQHMANEALSSTEPAAYNQAIMDFGAVICKPQNPLCNTCPLHTHCVAFHLNIVDKLPQKTKKVKVSIRPIHYIVFIHKAHFYVRQRTQKDIWQNLYEVYSIDHITTPPQLVETITHLLPPTATYTQYLFPKIYTQRLTHRLIKAQFSIVNTSLPPLKSTQLIAVNKDTLTQFAFPKILRSFWNDFFKHTSTREH